MRKRNEPPCCTPRTNCTLTLSNCWVQLSSANGSGFTVVDVGGGGIYNAGTLTLAGCQVRQNSANGTDRSFGSGVGGNASGGGLYSVGTMTLTECFLLSNVANGGDGAGFDFNNIGYSGGTGYGGGIYNAGGLTLNRSTLQSSSANGGRGPDADPGFISTGGAGGVARGGGLFNAGWATLTQTTFGFGSANGGRGGNGNTPLSRTAGSGANSYGGGIYNTGPLTINQSTLRSFSVRQGLAGTDGPAGPTNGVAEGGGIFNTAPGTNCTLLNSIIARNTAPLLVGAASNSDASGIFSSRGHNLVGATDNSTGFGVSGDLTGDSFFPLDPLLGALVPNGGTTPTVPLLAGSPAIDAGDDSVTNSLATDQRGTGFPRRVGAHVDIGAYEFGTGTFPPVISSLTIGSVTLDPVTQFGSVTVSASVTPNATVESPTVLWVDYGVSSSYGLTVAFPGTLTGTNPFPRSVTLTDLAPGLTWHYRWAATNIAGADFSADQSVSVGPQLYSQAQYNTNGVTNFNAGLATGTANVTNSPNTYGLYTLTQYTTNGATNFIVGRNTGRSDVTNAPNTYGLYTLTQYTTNGATNFIVGRNTGRSDVTNAPNTYNLFTLSQYNTNGVTNFNAGVATVTNAPNSFSLYTLTQYTTNGATNFIVGRNTGRSDVTNAPNTYNLFTLSQYNTNGVTNFNAGVKTVTNAPNSFSLYSLTQYTTNGSTNFIVGRNTGRSDVTNSPNSYSLYTTTQIQALNVGTPLLQKNPTNGLFKLTLGVQKATSLTTNLTNFVAFPMNGPGSSTAINGQGKLEFQFPGSNNAAFFRLQSQ